MSPSALSIRFCQYANTSFARSFSSSSRLMCSRNSSSVRLLSAASVVEQSMLVELMSSSGGGGGPFLFPALEADESTDVDEAFSFLTLPNAPLRLSAEGRGDFSPGMCIDGNTSFFCLDAGRISSRSTGTPSDTRNSRRMRERTQSGGCKGGGATSCDQRDSLRSERKMDRRAAWLFVVMLGTSFNDGYISSI